MCYRWGSPLLEAIFWVNFVLLWGRRGRKLRVSFLCTYFILYGSRGPFKRVEQLDQTIKYSFVCIFLDWDRLYIDKHYISMIGHLYTSCVPCALFRHCLYTHTHTHTRIYIFILVCLPKKNKIDIFFYLKPLGYHFKFHVWLHIGLN